MAQPFVLLTAFGSAPGGHWFRTAFNWDQDQIFQWLDDVSKGKLGGPRAKDPAVQKLLKDAYSKIRALSLPNGAKYLDPEPSSHFPRSLNSDWGKPVEEDPTDQPKDKKKKDDKPKVSKFRLHEWSNIYRRGPKDALITVPYWSPYDLLGYFLSLLGPAPEAANKSNYFLPLTAVYARWCSRIAGRAPGGYRYPTPGNGAGNWPYMFQCTWHDDGGTTPKWFFLGASIGGDSWSVERVGGWKETVQRHRFMMLWSCSQLKLVRKYEYEQKQAPEQKNPGSANPFGNCAETYPFTEKMFSDKNKNRNLYGFALMRDFMKDPNLTVYDEFRDGVIWENLCAPCRNCGALVQRAGALEDRFARHFDIERAPERPGVGGLEIVADKDETLTDGLSVEGKMKPLKADVDVSDEEKL